jgi:cytidylate kinase
MKKHSVITISGLPGTGTTTAAKVVAERLGFLYVNQGYLFRKLAEEKGLELNDFGRYAREHPEIDQELDARQIELARRGNVVLEGRLSGLMVTRAGLSAFRVWIQCADPVRWPRIALREGLTPDEARAKHHQRELDERVRFQEIYGVDLFDTGIYDLVLDSATLDIAGIQAAILGPLVDQ